MTARPGQSDKVLARSLGLSLARRRPRTRVDPSIYRSTTSLLLSSLLFSSVRSSRTRTRARRRWLKVTLLASFLALVAAAISFFAKLEELSAFTSAER